MAVGNTPLKTNVEFLKKEDYLCGEKAYLKTFNIYKPVCHFIMAFQYMKGDTDGFLAWRPDKVEHFISLSLWFRKQLLQIERTNDKEVQVFPNDVLTPLPAWVKCQGINLPIEIYEDKRLK